MLPTPSWGQLQLKDALHNIIVVSTIPHLDSILVFLASQVALKDVRDVFLLGKLLPPHGPQTLRLPPATQVKQVIVLEFPKSWGG